MAHLFIAIMTKFVNETIRYLLVLSFAIIVCMVAHTIDFFMLVKASLLKYKADSSIVVQFLERTVTSVMWCAATVWTRPRPGPFNLFRQLQYLCILRRR